MRLFDVLDWKGETERLKPQASWLFFIWYLLVVVSPFAVYAEDVGQKELHHERSLYRNIFVFEKDGVRCMRFGKRFHTGDSQSCMFVDNPDKIFFGYASLMVSSLYLNPAPERILVIGLGGGSIPTALSKLAPDAHIDVVEIDPAVNRVAKQFFDFTVGDKLKVHEVDGRVFVKRAAYKGVKYDIVMLDAFNGDYIPEHLLTQEFLTEVRQILSPNGVLAANTFSRSKLYDSESVTYSKVFGDFFNANLAFGNRVILWRDGGLPSMETLVKNADSYAAQFEPLGIEKSWILSKYSREKEWDAAARILTDQYSPSNLLNSR